MDANAQRPGLDPEDASRPEASDREPAPAPQEAGPNGVDILTFGCRLNAYESEVMRRNAEAAGLKDAVIVNTCAVTGEAVRQARQAIRRARRNNPEAEIIVTGCAAQVEPERFAAMDAVSRVLGNTEKLNPTAFLPAEDNARITVSDIMQVKETAAHFVDAFPGRVRAFVQVQTGCDHRCTFCIIPFGRGNSRSVPAGAVIEEIAKLVATGYQEVALTGVDLTSYGHDLPGQPTLGQLVKRILTHVPALMRLRISSIDPVEIDDLLFRLLVEEARVLPHVHLSIQAGDDMILKRMKRRHLRQEAIDIARRLKTARPDLALGADIIAGFPTETEEMFQNTLALVEEADLSFLHVFPFSPRDGTPAARMPQLDRAIIKERAARLRQAGARALRRLQTDMIGTEQTLLMEKPAEGRAGNFVAVAVDTPQDVGALARVKIVGMAGDGLKSVIVDG